jgi:hypothetical protein
VKDQLGEEKLQEIGKALAEQIENQRHPKVAAGTPWEPAAPQKQTNTGAK